MKKIIIAVAALSMLAGGSAFAGSASSSSFSVSSGGSYAFAASKASASSSSSGPSTASARGFVKGTSGTVTLSITKDGTTTTGGCGPAPQCRDRLP